MVMHFFTHKDNNAHAKSNPIMAIVNVKEVYSGVFNFAIVKITPSKNPKQHNSTR